MHIERHRYLDPPGLLRRRRAVVVTDRGLVEEFRAGGDRLTLWSQVSGVRWVRHGVAEVRRTDGRAIRLPEGLRGIEELVGTIESVASRSQAPWREQGVPAHVIAGWLRITRNGYFVHDANLSAAVIGAMMALAGLLALFGGLAYALPGIPCLLAGVSTLVVAARRGLPIVIANGRDVSWRRGTDWWSVPWSEVRSVEVTPRCGNWPATIRLTTSDGVRELSGPAMTFAPLADAAQRVAQANTARFTGAGAEPIPDTALSPARMAGSPEAERGLSQTTD